MAVRIPSYRLKFDRSQEHVAALVKATKTWLEGAPFAIEDVINTQTGMREIAIVALEQPPDRLAILAGDAIQNLRNSLDHVLVEASAAASGGHLMERIEKDIQYPITSTRSSFRSQRRRGGLGLIPAELQVLVSRLQPYRAGDDMFVHPLSVLQRLSNLDKHRRLPLLLSVVRSVRMSDLHVVSAKRLQLLTVSVIADRAVLMQMDPADEVTFNLDGVVLDVGLGEGGARVGAPLADTIGDLSRFVVDYIL